MSYTNVLAVAGVGGSRLAKLQRIDQTTPGAIGQTASCLATRIQQHTRSEEVSTLQRTYLIIAALGALSGGLMLSGCKGDSQLSKDEVQQVKDGPPKEMPPQAREAMQRGMQGAQQRAAGPATSGG